MDGVAEGIELTPPSRQLYDTFLIAYIFMSI